MAELKQGRWVKVHEPGQANFSETENVMDIVIGSGRCQADATYTVRSYKKAAFWLAEYLKAAEALQIVADDAMSQIQIAADGANRDDDSVSVSGEGWSCEIEKMCDGSFKVQLSWAVNEPVTKKETGKKKTAPKKRGRKKKTPEKAEVADEQKEVK